LRSREIRNARLDVQLILSQIAIYAKMGLTHSSKLFTKGTFPVAENVFQNLIECATLRRANEDRYFFIAGGQMNGISLISLS
jgi:hypothetical protein